MKLLDYITGSRRGREAQQIERQAMDDPMLADALEGYDSVSDDHLHRLERLHRVVTERPLHRRIVRRALAVAAAVLLCCGVGGYLYLMQRADRSLLTLREESDSAGRAVAIAPTPPSDELSDSEAVVSLAKVDKPNAECATLHREEPISESSSAQALFERGVSIAEVRGNDCVSSQPNDDERIAPLPATDHPASAKQRIETPIAVDQSDYEVAASDDAAVLRRHSGKDSATGEATSHRPDVSQEDDGSQQAVIVHSGAQKHPTLVGGIASVRSKELSLQKPSFKVLGRAEPVDGTEAYAGYVLTARRTEAERSCHGKVTLSFWVNQEGCPEQIKVVRSAGAATDSLALRLLRDGGTWQPAGSRGRCQIEF